MCELKNIVKEYEKRREVVKHDVARYNALTALIDRHKETLNSKSYNNYKRKIKQIKEDLEYKRRQEYYLEKKTNKKWHQQ